MTARGSLMKKQRRGMCRCWICEPSLAPRCVSRYQNVCVHVYCFFSEGLFPPQQFLEENFGLLLTADDRPVEGSPYKPFDWAANRCAFRRGCFV